MSRVGDKIKEARIKNGLSQKALAKKLGVAEKFINEVELGRRIAQESFIDKASKILKTDFNDVSMVVTDEALLEEYLKHDNDLKGTGIVNKDLHMTEGMFDWTEKEEREFYLANIERIVKTLNVKDGAKEYIDKLKQDGHNIFIITGRE